MDSGNIKVFVRVRPPSEKEQAEGLCVDIIDKNTIKIRQSSINPTPSRFSFDGIFSAGSSQQEVFEVVGRTLISNVFEGINGTTFTYGQTASGKTWTCMGPDIASKENKGLIPRIIDEVFRKIGESEGIIEFCLKVSLVEIYQQRVRDLLDPQKNDLRIRQNKAKGIYLQDVTEKYVATAQQVMALLQQGSENRSLGHTCMNEASSRSHMVFLLTIHQNNLRDLSAKSAKITLVDLAGSEKIAKTGAEGKLLDEAKYINKSLSALGNVINSLTEAKIGHVPYRDSKLTRILQQSLGGNAKTNLIINISPSAQNEPETISTLRFGHRAKNIKNKPKVNKEYTVPELLLLLQKAELRLQEQGDIIKKLLSGQYTQLDETSQIKKSVKALNDESCEQQQQNSFRPQRVKKLRSATYVSPLQQEYTQGGLETESQQRQLIDIRLLEMQIASQKKKSIRLRCQLHRVKMENTELNRENVLLSERYNACSTQLEKLQGKFDTVLQENSQLIEKQSTVQERLQSLLEENSALSEAAEAYSKIKQQTVALNKAGMRNSGMLQVFGQYKPNVQEKPAKRAESRLGETTFQCTLESRIRQLEEQLKGYENLTESRQRFEKEKSQFNKEKSGLLSDLQNRIFKVIELEEQLDFEKSKRIHLQKTIEMSQQNQAAKITALQGFISELTASYYVLKNQELCWKTESKLFETKLKRVTARSEELEKQLKFARSAISEMNGRISELQAPTRIEPSILKPNYDANIRRNSGADIVKVVRATKPHPTDATK